jgi:thiol-disulfide isomerase/thioredoxin
MNEMTRLTLCFLMLLALGCSKQKETDDLNTLTIINGQVQNLDVYPTTSSFTVEVKDLRDRISLFSGSINEDGTFRIAFDLYAPQDVRMKPLGDLIIAHPGDSIFIDFDFADIGNIRFSGDRAETNRILQKYQNSYVGSVNYSPFGTFEMDAYQLYCDSVRADALEKHEHFVSEENPPNDFTQWSSDRININYYYSKLFYPFYHFREDEEGLKVLSDSTNYYDFLEDVKTDYSNYGSTIVHSDIYNLAGVYSGIIWRKVWENTPEGEVPQTEDFLDELNEIENGSVFKEILMGITSYHFLLSQEFDKFQTFKETFDKQIKAPFLRLPLTELYNQSMLNHKNPKIASDSLFNTMGAEGKELLDSIISENKGKVLFIDLWATWCTPCIQGMKTAKEIMPKYENEDIEFIYLCVNSTEENWQTTLTRLDIGGQHYFCDDSQSRDIKAALNVEGIPHYFIINKNGYIVQPNSHDLSGSEEKLSALLKE